MKKLLALAGTYLLAWATAGFLWFDWTNAAAERGRHAIALGEQQAALLARPEGLPELAQACDGKLVPGDPQSIAAYIAKSLVKPADENTYDEVLVGIDSSRLNDVARERGERFVPVELGIGFRGSRRPRG